MIESAVLEAGLRVYGSFEGTSAQCGVVLGGAAVGDFEGAQFIYFQF